MRCLIYLQIEYSLFLQVSYHYYELQVQVVTTAPGQFSGSQVLPAGVKLEVMGSANPLVVTSQSQNAAATSAGLTQQSATPVLMQSQAVKVELVKPPFSVPQIQVCSLHISFLSIYIHVPRTTCRYFTIRSWSSTVIFSEMFLSNVKCGWKNMCIPYSL